MNYKLIAYAEDFVSFLLQNMGKKSENIKQIILFGSVARSQETVNSDIDLFIEAPEELQKEILKIKEDFYHGVKFSRYWKLLGVKTEINCQIGELNKWKELQQSVAAGSLVLFGPYLGKSESKAYYLFEITLGKDRNKNISLWRKLYGYKQKIGKKMYEKPGLIKEYGGERMGTGIVMIPVEQRQKMQDFFKKEHLKYKLRLIWLEGEK